MRGPPVWVLALAVAGCAEEKPAKVETKAMNEDRFWQLIEESRTRAKAQLPLKKNQDFADLHEPALQAVLEGLAPQEVAEFDARFRRYSLDAYRWDLWAAAYWIGGGCSDDGFMDFRANLVSLGKDSYTKVLADPDALADVVGRPDTPFLQSEGIGYIASQVYRKKTGKEPPDDPSRRYPEKPGKPDWDFDFDDEAEMRRRLPKLTSKVKMGDD